MDDTDKAIDGTPTKSEAFVRRLMSLIVLYPVVVGFVVLLGWMLGFEPNPWFWIAALLLGVVVTWPLELVRDALLAKRIHTQHDPEHWSPS